MKIIKVSGLITDDTYQEYYIEFLGIQYNIDPIIMIFVMSLLSIFTNMLYITNFKYLNDCPMPIPIPRF